MTPFERLLSIMIKPWVAASVIGFIVLSYLYLDEPLAYFLYGLDLRGTSLVWNIITDLGLGAIYFVSLFLLGLYFRYVRPNPQWESKAWFLWLCAVVPSILCLGIKMFFGRARPGLLLNDQIYGFFGLQFNAQYWSFPSGHTTTVMGFVFGLCVVFPRYFYAFIVAGLVISLSRVLLIQHFFSDVVTATYLSLLGVGLVFCILKKRQWLSFVPNKQTS